MGLPEFYPVTNRRVLSRRNLTLSLAAGLLQACSKAGAPVKTSERAAADAAPAMQNSSPAFVNKLWKVSRSTGVEPGQLYVFFADGTLLITSSHGTPALGRWEHRADTLMLIEEGLRHPATVRHLLADTFAITVRGGGQPLDITFVRETAP